MFFDGHSCSLATFSVARNFDVTARIFRNMFFSLIILLWVALKCLYCSSVLLQAARVLTSLVFRFLSTILPSILASSMNDYDYDGLLMLLRIFDVYRRPFAPTPANLTRLAAFGLERGRPNCPYNTSVITCNEDGFITKLSVLVLWCFSFPHKLQTFEWTYSFDL